MKTVLRRSVERHPLLWAAGLAIGAVVVADGHRMVGILWALPLLGLLVWSGARRVLIGSLLVGVLAGALHFMDSSRRSQLIDEMGPGKTGPLTARLLERPRTYGRVWVAPASAGEDRVWLVARGEAPPAGALVGARGRYRPVEGPRNPGQFDPRSWLERQGIFAVFEAQGEVQVLAPPAAWRSAGEGIRTRFRDSVTRGLDPLSRGAVIIRAVVIGEHPENDLLIEPFRLTGTLHVFAVSGLHVGMVGLLGWLVLRAIGFPRRWAIPVLILMVFGYAWLTGLKPPAVRAAWMATVVLGAFWFRRRPDLLNALGLAALSVTLFDGDLLFRAGVQLSFLVVLAIGLLHRQVSRLFVWIEKRELYLPRVLYGRWREGWLGFRRLLSGWLTVSTSAWLGSAPLTVFYFGLLTPISVIASVFLSLLAFGLLAQALFASLLSPIPRVAESLNRLNAALAEFMYDLAETGALIPGGHFAVPRDRPAKEFMIIYDLGSDGASTWRIGGESLLIDAGSRRSFERVLLPSMRRMALRPRSFVASHPDGGHVGGLIEALDAFPIEQGLMPVLKARGPNYRDLLSAGESRGVRLIRGRVGQVYPIAEGGWLEVLAEPSPWNWNAVADDRVMPLRLHWHGWKILLMADAGWAIERELMERGIDVKADVVVVGRHLHDASLGSEFLRMVGARAVVASHSSFPSEERIPSRWREACETRGLPVFHQGECGAVTLRIEEGRLRLEGFLDERVILLD